VGQEYSVDNGKSQAKERNVASVCAEVVAIFLHSVILRPLDDASPFPTHQNPIPVGFSRSGKSREGALCFGQKLWRHLPQIVRVK